MIMTHALETATHVIGRDAGAYKIVRPMLEQPFAAQMLDESRREISAEDRGRARARCDLRPSAHRRTSRGPSGKSHCSRGGQDATSSCIMPRRCGPPRNATNMRATSRAPWPTGLDWFAAIADVIGPPPGGGSEGGISRRSCRGGIHEGTPDGHALGRSSMRTSEKSRPGLRFVAKVAEDEGTVVIVDPVGRAQKSEQRRGLTVVAMKLQKPAERCDIFAAPMNARRVGSRARRKRCGRNFFGVGAAPAGEKRGPRCHGCTSGNVIIALKPHGDGRKAKRVGRHRSDDDVVEPVAVADSGAHGRCSDARSAEKHRRQRKTRNHAEQRAAVRGARHAEAAPSSVSSTRPKAIGAGTKRTKNAAPTPNERTASNESRVIAERAEKTSGGSPSPRKRAPR